MSNGLQEFLSEPSGSDPATEEPTTPQGEEAQDTPPPSEETAGEAPETAADSDTPPEGTAREQAIWREERTRRKELQAQVDKMNDRWAQMMERMSAPQQQQQPEAVEIPDFDEDPIGHLRAKNELLERHLQAVRMDQQQTTAINQQAQQFNQMRSNVNAMETEFATATPDYHDAVGFLYENIRKTAQALGYDPQQVQQAVSQTAMDISMRALQQGKNPAEMAYAAARNMGWANEQPAGEAVPAGRKPPTSLSSVSGKRVAPGAPTWDAISGMDDAEFEAFWAQMEKKASR